MCPNKPYDELKKITLESGMSFNRDYKSIQLQGISILNQGCVPLVESKKGFDVTDFLDLRLSMGRQIQKRRFITTNTREFSLL